MSTLPFYAPKFRAFDANGDPLAGGKLYTYAAGTSDPLDTFTTRAGNFPNENPVILNANGEADVWTTPGLLYKFVLADSNDEYQWTVDNVPSGSVEGASAADASATVDPGGRLTLASGVPVTEAEYSSVTTIYYTPFRHNKVPLYDGSAWTLASVTELSQALSDTTKSPAAAVAGNNYDLFIWVDSGTHRLSRGPLWNSTTARGSGTGTTELERVDGRYVNKYAVSNGPAAQRGLYVGTIHVTSGGVDDNLGSRHCWNAYNLVRRPMAATDATNSWIYSDTAFRAANGNSGNRLSFVTGLPGDSVRADVFAIAEAELTDVKYGVGIGVDSTTANSATTYSGIFPSGVNVGEPQETILAASYEGFPGLGRHTLTWLERASVSGPGDVTWFGTYESPEWKKTGITGHLFA